MVNVQIPILQSEVTDPLGREPSLSIAWRHGGELEVAIVKDGLEERIYPEGSVTLCERLSIAGHGNEQVFQESALGEFGVSPLERDRLQSWVPDSETQGD